MYEGITTGAGEVTRDERRQGLPLERGGDGRLPKAPWRAGRRHDHDPLLWAHCACRAGLDAVMKCLHDMMMLFVLAVPNLAVRSCAGGGEPCGGGWIGRCPLPPTYQESVATLLVNSSKWRKGLRFPCTSNYLPSNNWKPRVRRGR